MARLVGFDNVLKPVAPKAMYNSKTKGPIAIEDMATKHIENALRGILISLFAEMLKGKSFYEMVTLLNGLCFIDFVDASTDVKNMYEELLKR